MTTNRTETTTTRNLAVGDAICHDLTGAVVARVADIARTGNGRFTLTLTDGRTFRGITGDLTWRVAA